MVHLTASSTPSSLYWTALYDWTTTDSIALISAVAATLSAVAAILALWPHVRQRIVERRVSKDFGADIYLPEVIRAATLYYVRPDASSLDLSQELEEPSNRVPTREDLFKAIERFLDDESGHRHLFLLADSGMGKSAFVLNFYAHNRRRFAVKRYRLAVIPLGYSKVIERIRDIENKRNTVIFLDAFDEDPLARADYWTRLKALLEECSEFKRVLITCRTQFFPKDDAIPVSTGLIKLGPRNDEGFYEFWRLYIAPLSDNQVDKYLRRRYRIWDYVKRTKARAIVEKIPLLSLRPMLLTHIPEIMSAKETIVYSWQLYELMIRAWYNREKHWWQDVKSIRIFSEEVAVKLYSNYLQQKADRIPRLELSEIIRSVGVAIDEWNATSRSLLHRDAQGNFKFAHRSIMEYLFLKRYIAGDERCRNVPWTGQMRKFMIEILRTPRTAEGSLSIWERYSLVGADLSESDLSNVDLRSKDLSWASFRKADLTNADCRGAILVGTDFSDANLFQCDLSTATDESYYGWGKPQNTPPNFQRAVLTSSKLRDAKLRGANFHEANLTNADMVKIDLRGANMRYAKLSRADLKGARLVEADFSGAVLTGAELNSAGGVIKTSLKGSNFETSIGLSFTELGGCELDENTVLPNEFESLKTKILTGQRDLEEFRKRADKELRQRNLSDN